MIEYSWPDESRAVRACNAWAATVDALPVGTRVEGEVIARQPFGVFIQIDAVPEALGLIETIGKPCDEAPAPGTRVSGRVIHHAEHNHQVRVWLIQPQGMD
ncbi:hypothetical protein [Embleya sp. NPDC005971]|uniref:hypothetical protein n=1 Tax=Embleya sp. NPDC005971 TaxID=3156724 RepID=UPI0033E22C3D